MKQSHQIALLAAVGIGAYLMLRSNPANAGALRVGTGQTYPMQPTPIPGTAAYQDWLTKQQQTALETQKMGVLYQIGKTIGSVFGGGGTSTNNNPAAGQVWNGVGGIATGTTGIFGDWTAASDGTAGQDAAQQYVLNNPDAFAVNPPVITNDMQLAAIAQGQSEY